MNLLVLFCFVLLYSENNTNELLLVLDAVLRWQTSFLSNRDKYFSWFVSCQTWHKLRDLRIVYLGWNYILCLFSEESPIPSVQAAMPRRKMTTRPERDIRESSARLLMPMERQSRCWRLRPQFHIIKVKGSFVIGLAWHIKTQHTMALPWQEEMLS